MAKTSPLGLRLSEEARAALVKAAADDMRPVASMLEKITLLWLREHGYLGPSTPPTAPVQRRSRKSAT